MKARYNTGSIHQHHLGTRKPERLPHHLIPPYAEERYNIESTSPILLVHRRKTVPLSKFSYCVVTPSRPFHLGGVRYTSGRLASYCSFSLSSSLQSVCRTRNALASPHRPELLRHHSFTLLLLLRLPEGNAEKEREGLRGGESSPCQQSEPRCSCCVEEKFCVCLESSLLEQRCLLSRARMTREETKCNKKRMKDAPLR